MIVERRDPRDARGVPDEAADRLRILIADDDELSGRMAARLLTARGFSCETARDGETALARARSRPDVLLLDVHMAPMDGLEVLERLQADHRTALLPVICVTGDRRLETLMALLAAGADDYVTKPFDLDELQARILVATRRRVRLGGISPLTGLPGNVLLTRGIQQRIDGDGPFGFLHVDLDHFKAYNDRYGYVRGDDVIRALAVVLEDAVDDLGVAPVVLGHVGGDDFGVVAPAEVAARLADEVVARFDALVPGFHDPEDLVRGGIVVRGRQGDEREHPLVSVSIGVVVWTDEHPPDPKAVADVAAEVKRVAKGRPGSQVAVDRRRPGGSRPPR